LSVHPPIKKHIFLDNHEKPRWLRVRYDWEAQNVVLQQNQWSMWSCGGINANWTGGGHRKARLSSWDIEMLSSSPRHCLSFSPRHRLLLGAYHMVGTRLRTHY
jgi:hypothetical protein